jgi:glycogen operon protein
MILGGDEFLRSQQGNNNAYCRDNEISWFDWEQAARNGDVLEFFRKAIALTRRYPILQRRKFFLGHDLDADGVPDLEWFGNRLDRPDWHDAERRTVCLRLDGGEEDSQIGDYLLFWIVNTDHRAQWVQLPVPVRGERWYRIIDTSLASGDDFADPGEELLLNPADHYIANARSTVLLLGR